MDYSNPSAAELIEWALVAAAIGILFITFYKVIL